MVDSFRDTPTGEPGGASELTVTLEETDNGAATTMTVSQFFEVNADRDAYYRMGAPMGWGQSFDKLERLVLAADSSA